MVKMGHSLEYIKTKSCHFFFKHFGFQADFQNVKNIEVFDLKYYEKRLVTSPKKTSSLYVIFQYFSQTMYNLPYNYLSYQYLA